MVTNIKKMNLNKLIDKAYKTACEHGFHDNKYSNEHSLCLVIKELMEAVEAIRNDNVANMIGFKTCMKNAYQGIVRDDWFLKSYRANIKGCAEEELADAAIRLLDLAGYRNLKIEDFTEEEIEDASESCNDETFAESVYAISTIPIRYEYEYGFSIDDQLKSMLLAIFGLAKHLDIDILWHIEQRMRYNELRPAIHVKKY